MSKLHYPDFLPLMRLGERPRGFAGLISDTSLLDVETITIDKNGTGTALGGLFRSGTAAIVSRVSAKTGNRFGKPAVAADAKGADTTNRFVAIAFSHDTANQSGEVYYADPDDGSLIARKPANGVNIGRVWMLLNGGKPDTTGRAQVAVADLPASATPFDATKPYVNGAVKNANATGADAIPGWFFTGAVEIDPATGYNIAEVEIARY